MVISPNNIGDILSFNMIGKGKYLDDFINELKMTYAIQPQWIRIIKFMYPNSTFEVSFDKVYEDIVMNCAYKHKFIRQFKN